MVCGVTLLATGHGLWGDGGTRAARVGTSRIQALAKARLICPKVMVCGAGLILIRKVAVCGAWSSERPQSIA